MRVTFYKSAGVLLESGGSRLLCDPWLKDGAYYGAWAHVPPCDVTPAEIGPLDGIYITHIHPDHYHEDTLRGFPRTVPVYIHRYAFSYLADTIRGMGFKVCELVNGETAKLGGLSLTIYAADNCDPSVCGQFFGCDARVGAERPGSVQIDSLAVISDGQHTVLNVNDCPYDLVAPAAEAIRQRCGRPDLLLVNYVGAGPFPQCMTSLSRTEKIEAGARKREQFLKQAERYVALFQPKAFMPFAGTYTLAGKLARLNQYRGVPTMREAACELAKRCESKVVCLDTRQTYDCATGEVVGNANPWTPEQIADYEAYLVGRPLDYEQEVVPPPYRLASQVRIAGERFRKRCEQLGYASETRVYVAMDDYMAYRLPMGDVQGRMVRLDEARRSTPHVILSCDPRLLMWLLTGKAHWQDASVGSHLSFERRPDVFDRTLEFCLNDLHE